MKKLLLRIVNLISVAAILIALFVLLTVVMTKSGEAPNILGHYVFRVMTGSMEPAVPTDSLIVVRETELSQIQPDDIISYYSEDPQLNGSVNTHRVVSVKHQGENHVFTTKGDANALPDKYPASGKNVLGKVNFMSHSLGTMVNFLSSPIAFVVLIVIPLFLILISNLVRMIRSARQLLREEEEAAVRDAVEELKRRKQEEEESRSE